MTTKYVAKPSFRGNSQCVDMVEEVEDKPRSDTPINDYLQALDDRFTQSQQELKRDIQDVKDVFKKQLENSSDYVVRTLVERDESKGHDKLKTFLYGGAFVALVYLHAISPVLNTTGDISRRIIGLLPIANTTEVPAKNNPIPSNIDPVAVINTMQSKGYKVRTGPGELNVVYLYNPNFAETIDTWSDRRLLITFKDNQPVIVHDSPATIKGGKPSWLNPPNPKGYPVVNPGQYNAWAVGYHKGRRALQQVGSIPVMRTKDQGRTWQTDRGLFGINQHRGSGQKVRNWSEGCLVSQSGHEEFMQLIYTDPGYRQNKNFRFITTIISINDLATPRPQLNNISERNAKQI